MPLSEKSLVLLNHLKSIIPSDDSQDLFKNTFKEILSNGDMYKIGEIEDWLAANMGENPSLSERILNAAHYQKAKYDAKNPLKFVQDSCGCGGDC
ncbi:MAG: hypothetical protein ABI342_01780 [Nitrososphaera sp.]|jgi:hypothetical protein